MGDCDGGASSKGAVWAKYHNRSLEKSMSSSKMTAYWGHEEMRKGVITNSLFTHSFMQEKQHPNKLPTYDRNGKVLGVHSIAESFVHEKTPSAQIARNTISKRTKKTRETTKKFAHTLTLTCVLYAYKYKRAHTCTLTRSPIHIHAHTHAEIHTSTHAHTHTHTHSTAHVRTTVSTYNLSHEKKKRTQIQSKQYNHDHTELITIGHSKEQ